MFQIVKFRSDALLGEIKMHSSLEGSIVKHEQGNRITHLETLKLKIHRQWEQKETILNCGNGAQYDPNPQDKTYTRVNETECKVDKPTCSQANKTITKAAAEDACEDACNGRDVVWNDDICAWECAKADVCDAAKRNCLEQNPPECGNNMNGQNTKSGGDKTLNQQTCEWEDCECIDLDNNNDDHKCFDKDGNFTGMKTLNDRENA